MSKKESSNDECDFLIIQKSKDKVPKNIALEYPELCKNYSDYGSRGWIANTIMIPVLFVIIGYLITVEDYKIFIAGVIIQGVIILTWFLCSSRIIYLHEMRTARIIAIERKYEIWNYRMIKEKDKKRDSYISSIVKDKKGILRWCMFNIGKNRAFSDIFFGFYIVILFVTIGIGIVQFCIS